jgi:hypothetical protein
MHQVAKYTSHNQRHAQTKSESLGKKICQAYRNGKQAGVDIFI